MRGTKDKPFSYCDSFTGDLVIDFGLSPLSGLALEFIYLISENNLELFDPTNMAHIDLTKDHISVIYPVSYPLFKKTLPKSIVDYADETEYKKAYSHIIQYLTKPDIKKKLKPFMVLVITNERDFIQTISGYDPKRAQKS